VPRRRAKAIQRRERHCAAEDPREARSAGADYPANLRLPMNRGRPERV